MLPQVPYDLLYTDSILIKREHITCPRPQVRTFFLRQKYCARGSPRMLASHSRSTRVRLTDLVWVRQPPHLLHRRPHDSRVFVNFAHMGPPFPKQKILLFPQHVNESFGTGQVLFPFHSLMTFKFYADCRDAYRSEPALRVTRSFVSIK